MFLAQIFILNRITALHPVLTVTGSILLLASACAYLRRNKGWAEIEWTFPLNFYELVWGDGKSTYRKVVHVPETGQFRRPRFQLREKLPAAGRVRFAIRDEAANGAFP